MRFLYFITLIFFVLSACNTDTTTKDKDNTDTLEIQPEPKKMYDLIVDSFRIEHGEVLKNQNLSEILLPYGISYQQIDEIVKLSDSIFDFRKIREGRPYAVFYPLDTAKPLAYFIYEHTPVQYLVIDFTDSLKIYIKEKQIIKKEKTASGIIETSLWNAMVDNDLDPMLAVQLSEIYAWSINFFRLQKGDKFKIIYEEDFVDDNSIGITNIIAAQFVHMDSSYYAIPFEQDSIKSFFDENGNSLRKAFLKAPLRYSYISSGFSGARMHPILGVYTTHYGVDYAAPYGTPVMALGDGRVIFMGYAGGAGNMVKIEHNSVYTTAYLHLSAYGNIKTGDIVKQGDIIGYVGSTGLSTGPHLDFRVYRQGHPIDPLTLESPPVDPVKDSLRAEYDKVVEFYLKKLNNISFK